VAAPAQQLEDLVRAELREPVRDLVARLVPELVAEALNGHTASAPMPLRLRSAPAEATVAPTATPDPPPGQKRCSGCGQLKPTSDFRPSSARCRTCRAAYERRRVAAKRGRQQQDRPEPDPPDPPG
jgi:hypothetical protein